MCPASCQCNRGHGPLPFLGKAGVGAVGIALEGAGKVLGYDFVQALSGSAGVPGEDGVATGGVGGPKVAELCFTMSRTEVRDGSLSVIQSRWA